MYMYFVIGFYFLIDVWNGNVNLKIYYYIKLEVCICGIVLEGG